MRLKEILAEEHADLLAADGGTFVLIDHLRDDEQIFGKGLGFRPLAGVEDVFERERVEVELFADGLERLDVAEAVDVDPGDSAAMELRAEFGEVGDFTFLEMILFILDEMDGRADDLAIDEVGNQRGRR